MNMNRPMLVLVRGLPGSGKSHVAKSLAEHIGLDHVVSLDPDATDYDSQKYKDFSVAQTEDGVEKKLHPYRFLRAQAYAGIEQDKVVIWNQAFTNLEIFHKILGRLQDHAATHNKNLALLVVEVDVDIEVAKQRVAERHDSGGHNVDEDNFARFVNDYRSFEGEGFTVVKVDGQADVAESVDRVMSAIKQL